MRKENLGKMDRPDPKLTLENVGAELERSAEKKLKENDPKPIKRKHYGAGFENYGLKNRRQQEELIDEGTD